MASIRNGIGENMEDRYLFKAKRLDNHDWILGFLSVHKTGKYFIRPIGGSALSSEEVDPTTICQCAGLKDKNGKLIWENDIVRDDNGNIYKAFWQDRYYQFSWICVKSDKLPIGAKWDFWSIRNYEIEVIGNIFDNPELLESEEN